MKTTAKIVADSVSYSTGIRLVTMELSYHRFIHSEFMTHRVFSRNAASSRAIPVKKQLEQVLTDPAEPVYWGMNKPGMQAGAEAEGRDLAQARREWRHASEAAVEYAELLEEIGLHKQIVNRLLEPWQIMKVVVTATEWENFFMLRISEFAQPEIKVLAEAMKVAMDGSIPVERAVGEWHVPYTTDTERENFDTAALIKISAGRCARVSYLNHDQSNPDALSDIALSNKLADAMHMSPFEHQAKIVFGNSSPGVTHTDRSGEAWSGNFKGWIQHRQLM